MKVTKALVGLAAVAAALTLTPTAGAQEAGALRSLSAACSPGGESIHMFSAAACPRPFLNKVEYAPGEAISIHVAGEKECASFEAISTGFAGKAKLTQAPVDGGYRVTGETTAVTTPGTYDATFRCNGQDQIHDHFTIKAATPPAPGKPKPPITKPKGAADTGGGGTA